MIQAEPGDSLEVTAYRVRVEIQHEYHKFRDGV